MNEPLSREELQRILKFEVDDPARAAAETGIELWDRLAAYENLRAADRAYWDSPSPTLRESVWDALDVLDRLDGKQP